MKFNNPILPGFHPDPSICRVGQDYYLVTSSFEYFPGVPIFHSRDLTHWRQIGFVLSRKSQLPLDGAAASGGIYAPTLRHYDGVFYMITTNSTDKGNFYVHTDDPAGTWSEPIHVGVPGVDPDLFRDDDGSWRISYSWDGIWQTRIDIASGKLLDKPALIWPGTGGRYVEGPHIYKINSTYYLMAAEGGTEYGHCETIARSRTVGGPWEACPHNPIFTHRDRGRHTIQGTGHGDMLQAHDGSWWMVMLAFRVPAGRLFHILGRETFLAPVKWDKDGWPIVGDGLQASGDFRGGPGMIELEMEGPNLPEHTWPQEPARDDFDGDKLKLCWNFLRNPYEADWSLSERPGFLRLKGSAVGLDDQDSPAFVGRRQQHWNFLAGAKLDFAPLRPGEEAGLTVLANNHHHYEIAVTVACDAPEKPDGDATAGNGISLTRSVVVRRRIGDLCAVVARQRIADGPVILEIRGGAEQYTFAIRTDEAVPSQPLATADVRYLTTEVAGGFTGAYIGMYATGGGRPAAAVADFDWFEYRPLQD